MSNRMHRIHRQLPVFLLAVVATAGAITPDEVRRLEQQALEARGEQRQAEIRRLDEQLSAGDQQARFLAATQLETLSLPPEARIEVFGDELDNESDVVRMYAIRALADSEEARARFAQAFADILHDEDQAWFTRAEAARALARTAGAEAQAALTRLLQATDTQPSVLAATASALGETGERAKAAIPALHGLLEHPSPGVRHASFVALGAIDPTARPAAEDDKAFFTRAEALRRVGEDTELNARDAVLIVDALRSDERYLQQEALRALESLTPEDSAVVEPLAAAMGDANPRVRRGIAVGLRHVGPQAAPAVPALLDALNATQAGADPALVNAYLAALREIRHDAPGLEETLVGSLSEDSALLQERSGFWRSILKSHLFVVLGATGNAASAESQILAALQGEDPYVFAGAAKAVAELGPEGAFAVDALARAVEPEAPDRYMMLDHIGMTTAKAEAVKALASIGPPAGDALPALKRLQQADTGYPPLRDLAARAIEAITNPS